MNEWMAPNCTNLPLTLAILPGISSLLVLGEAIIFVNFALDWDARHIELNPHALGIASGCTSRRPAVGREIHE